MLQLQPGERKVIKAAGEVDISTQYLRIHLSIYLRRTCLGSCRACTPGPAAAWAGHTGTPTPARWWPSPHCRGTGAHITISQYLMLMTILMSTHRQGSHGGSARPAGPRVPIHPPGGRGRVRLQVGRYIYSVTFIDADISASVIFICVASVDNIYNISSGAEETVQFSLVVVQPISFGDTPRTQVKYLYISTISISTYLRRW